MLGLELQIGLARAWSDAVFGCVSAYASASAAVLNQAASAAADIPDAPSTTPERAAGSSTRGQSWYRPPVAQPFDVSWFGLPMAFPMAYPMAWGQPMSAPFGGAAMMSVFQPWQAWATLLRSPFMSNPLASPAWWTAFAPAPAPVAAPQSRPRAQPASYVAYRSESGHAVTQFTFPNDVVAAVAVPPEAMTLDTFFTWPATRH